jgi:hypothetical protein
MSGTLAVKIAEKLAFFIHKVERNDDFRSIEWFVPPLEVSIYALL